MYVKNDSYLYTHTQYNYIRQWTQTEIFIYSLYVDFLTIVCENQMEMENYLNKMLISFFIYIQIILEMLFKYIYIHL